jgi:uncharacterized protein (DUF2342 family)
MERAGSQNGVNKNIPGVVTMRASGRSGTKSIYNCICSNEAARNYREKHWTWLAQAGRATRQSETGYPKGDENDRDLTKMADLLAQAGDRDNRNNQRRGAASEWINVAEIADPIGPI